MTIETASREHLPEIERLSWEHDFETDRDWRDLISAPEKNMFVMVEDGRIVGFTGLIHYEWNRTVQVSNVFVHPEYRGDGRARKLIQHVIDTARTMDCRCLLAEAPSQNPVKNLYEKMGFRKCGYNDRYYSNGGEEICIWMSLDLE